MVTFLQDFSSFLVDEDVIAGHVVQNTLMFTNPIDTDSHTADKSTATYDSNMQSGIRVVVRIYPGNRRDPSERNKGKYSFVVISYICYITF